MNETDMKILMQNYMTIDPDTNTTVAEEMAACWWLRSLPPSRLSMFVPPCVRDAPTPSSFQGTIDQCLCKPGEELKEQGCTKCIPGKAKGKMNPHCSKCPPGTMANREGMDRCAQCPPGRWQSGDGENFCPKCPMGRTTHGRGAVAESDCQSDSCTPPHQ